MRSGQLVAGRYRLEEVVGSGGMGVVWLASDLRLERPVAVKRASVPDRRGARQLLREAKNAARLHHPNSVAVFDAIEDDDGHCWLVMEYVPSTSLADLMLRESDLSPETVESIGAQVAGALAAMHTLGIVHRDVKPGNVLVTDQGIAKLTDFGISTWQETTVTETGPVPCTPGYLAPEVANGQEATTASDVFSLGATLYAAVEGMPPFGRGDTQQIMLRARGGTMPAPVKAGTLTPVLAALMATDPAARPSAATARDLLTGATGLPDPTVPAAPPHRPPRWKPRWKPIALAGAAAVVVALVAWLVVPGTDVRGTPRSEVAGSRPGGGAPGLGADPTAADPCALMSADSYADFGEPDLDKDYGSFARCDVLVDIGEDDRVDVSVEFDNATEDDDAPALTVRDEDDEEAADGCVRTVIIGDGHVAAVAARTYNGSGTTAADLCAMADTAATDAVDVLRRGEVPRHEEELPAESIANSDACAMVDGDAVSLVPSVDPDSPQQGFGNWYCRWTDPQDGPSSLLLLFDRNPPYSKEDGRPVRVGDHDAFVFPRGYGDDTCEVAVIHREYLNENDEDMIESLLVIVAGDGPAEPLCDKAQQVASRAAENLPPV